MEAVTVRGLEEGFSLGGEGEIRWNGVCWGWCLVGGGESWKAV